jgi:osmotically-inducible protein OsmY
MVAAGFAAALTLACGRTGDTEEMVRDALYQANIRAVDVHLERSEQTVRLTGTVETLADRVRAHELATAIVGTSGHVENEIAVEGLGVIEPRRHP